MTNDSQTTNLTPIEQAMMWERMSGERLPDAERQRILTGGEFCPPTGGSPNERPTQPTDPARLAAEKIVGIFGDLMHMHINDILPDIREAVAAKDAEIERLRVLVIHYADQAGVSEAEVRKVCKI